MRLRLTALVVGVAALVPSASAADPALAKTLQRGTPGTLDVLVTHGSVVLDTSGHSLEEGETLVYRPLGRSRFRLVGRILPSEWPTLPAA